MTEQNILKTALGRYDEIERVEDDLSEALDDLKFWAGDQWPEDAKVDRKAEERPMLTINRAGGFMDQVIGDQRQNKPQIKVVPARKGSSKHIARIMEGIIRKVEYDSFGSVAYNSAFDSAAACGRGFFRVLTKWDEDDSFDQVLALERISDIESVRWKRSPDEVYFWKVPYVFVTQKVSREDFKAMFPGKTPVDFESAELDAGLKRRWVYEDEIRIAEYWYKETIEESIYQVITDEKDQYGRPAKKIVTSIEGYPKERIIESEPGKPLTRKRRREVVKWCKLDGSQILEGPKVWPGKYIPIIPVWGKEIMVGGRRELRGLIRNMKDPQIMYNYWRTASTEIVSKTPKAPYLITPVMIDGFEDLWNNANKSDVPYLPYNPDPQAPQSKPTRIDPVPPPTGISQETMFCDEEMKATTGLWDANLGKKSNETSGRAILARQEKGHTATYIFQDNLKLAMVYAGKVMIDLIPKIYDTDRLITILDEKGNEQFVNINTNINPETDEVDEENIYNVLSGGGFDIRVITGPSYATKRMETADALLNFINSVPESGPFLGDILAETLDWHRADEVAKRLRFLLPPEMRAEIERDEAEERGETPEEPPATPPDPIKELEIQKAQAELQEQALKNKEIETNIELILSKIRHEEAEIEQLYSQPVAG